MKKRKTLEEREDEEEHKIKYSINTDLIEGFIKDQEEIQDVSSFRDQALAQLLSKDAKKIAMLPNQSMASVQELKKELLKARGNSTLQLSILETLTSKTSGQEKAEFLLLKIDIWLELNKLNEAENDIKSLLEIQPNSKSRLLYARILNRKKDPLYAMTQLLRCGIACEEIAVSELYNSLISQLAKTHYPQTIASLGSNINYTLGDGTQDSSQKPKFLQELKGKIVLQAVCGEFSTLIITSSCPHIARQEACSSSLGKCCGGVDVIGWGDNSHGQILGSAGQVIL